MQKDKTREELIGEIALLQKRIMELEKLDSEHKQQQQQQQFILDRKKVDDALQLSLEGLEEILNSLDGLVYVADMKTYETLFVNEYGKKIWGDFTGKTCWQSLQSGQKGPCSFCTNDRLLRPDGTSAGVYVWEFQNTVTNQWFECRDSAIFWPDGRTVRMEIAINITERKQVQEDLRKSSETVQLLLNSTAEAIYGLDESGLCTFANASCLKILGYERPEQLLGKNMHTMIHSKHADGSPYDVTRCPIFKAFREGREEHVDSEVLWRKDDTSFPAEYWSYPIFRENKVIGAVVTFLDITQRREAEAVLKGVASEWRRTFDAIADSIFILDKNNTIRKVNRIFLETFGLKEEQVIGKKCYEVVHKSGKPWIPCPHSQTMQDHKAHTEEVDDPVLGIPLLVSTSPIFDGKGELVGSVHIAKDISERKKVEIALKQKVAELENFNKIAVGRELKMIELKEKIKALEAKVNIKD